MELTAALVLMLGFLGLCGWTLGRSIGERIFVQPSCPQIDDRRPIPPVGRPPANYVDIDLLVWLADPRELAKATRDRDRVDFQVNRLRHEGPRDPLHLIIDQHGRITFADGYHRLAAALEVKRGAMPVLVLHSSKIGGWGRPSAGLLTHLLVGAPPPHRERS